MTDADLAAVSRIVRGYFQRRLPVDFVDDAVQDVLVLLLAHQLGHPGEIRCLNAYAIGVARHHRAGVMRRLCRERKDCDIREARHIATL
jgi:hypothetical protein